MNLFNMVLSHCTITEYGSPSIWIWLINKAPAVDPERNSPASLGPGWGEDGDHRQPLLCNLLSSFCHTYT